MAGVIRRDPGGEPAPCDTILVRRVWACDDDDCGSGGRDGNVEDEYWDEVLDILELLEAPYWLAEAEVIAGESEVRREDEALIWAE